MNESLQKSAATASDAELRSFVANAVSASGEHGKRLIRLERKLYDYHSSFAIEELTAVFDDGARLPLIFKNLSPDGLLPCARHFRPLFNYHPLREIAVYREILAVAGLGTATCYGALVDPNRGRYWLLLEKVAGDELYQLGDFSKWADAARWLATMHAGLSAAAKTYEHSARLLRYDEASCHVWIDRALQFHGQREHAYGPTITAARMQWLADQSRAAVLHLSSLPHTLVHGEFYASNVLVEQRGDQTRICPIDWETAALGPGLVDLAALIAGHWSEPQKQELAAAYYHALPTENRPWSSLREMSTFLRACQVFLAMRWLGWSADWQPPPEHRFDWLEEALQLAETIPSGVP